MPIALLIVVYSMARLTCLEEEATYPFALNLL